MKMFILCSNVNEKTKRPQDVGRGDKGSEAFLWQEGRGALRKSGLDFRKHEQ